MDVRLQRPLAKFNEAFLLSAGKKSQTRQVMGVTSENPSLLSPLVYMTIAYRHSWC